MSLFIDYWMLVSNSINKINEYYHSLWCVDICSLPQMWKFNIFSLILQVWWACFTSFLVCSFVYSAPSRFQSIIHKKTDHQKNLISLLLLLLTQSMNLPLLKFQLTEDEIQRVTQRGLGDMTLLDFTINMDPARYADLLEGWRRDQAPRQIISLVENLNQSEMNFWVTQTDGDLAIMMTKILLDIGQLKAQYMNTAVLDDFNMSTSVVFIVCSVNSIVSVFWGITYRRGVNLTYFLCFGWFSGGRNLGFWEGEIPQEITGSTNVYNDSSIYGPRFYTPNEHSYIPPLYI